MTINGGGTGLKGLIELLAALVAVWVVIAAVRMAYIVVEGHDDPVLLISVQTLLIGVVAAISAVLLKASR